MSTYCSGETESPFEVNVDNVVVVIFSNLHHRFAAIDTEWPALKAAYEAWLSPTNFDTNDRQIDSLSNLTGLVRVASDPLLEG